MSYQPVEISPLGPEYDRGAFCCGLEFIDRYVKKRCITDHDLHKARGYVATKPGSNVVVGFYTLSLTSLNPNDTTPEEAEEKFGSWAIPLVYLGQIGVQQEFQKGGRIGSAMMLHAFEQTLKIAELAGTYGMMLDAANEEVASWYEDWDFFRFDTESDGRIKMICSLTKIRAALNAN